MWQEIEEANDHADLDTVLPWPAWSHLARDTECPITTDRSVFQMVPEANSQGSVVISKGRAGVSPHRVLTWGIFYALANPSIRVVFANTHYVSGAFTNPGQVGDDDGWRKSTWLLGHAAARVQLAKFRDAGLTVVLGGDFNAPIGDMPAFWSDQIWVVSDGIDKIILLPAKGGAKVSILSTGRTPLISDHDLRYARLRITP